MEGAGRPMTAPSAGRRIVRPFYGNDLGLKPTGDSAGRYTFNSARNNKFRPASAAAPGTGSLGLGLSDLTRKGPRPSTAAVRRRYFFPQTISVSKTSTKQSPFYSHFDVSIPADIDQNADAGGASTKDHQSFYYRDYNQHQMEHYAQNRDLAPLHVDVDELRTWLTSARPRTAMDAGPLLTLCQNLMQSLLDEKKIVFERRAEQEKQDKDTEIDILKQEISRLQGEVEQSGKDKLLAESKMDSLMEKLTDSRAACLKAQRLLEQATEMVNMRDKKLLLVDAEITQLTESRDQNKCEANDLRVRLQTLLSDVQPLLSSLQSTSQIANAIDMMAESIPPRTISELWDPKVVALKVPESPSTDLSGLKLEERMRALRKVTNSTLTQLLVSGSDLARLSTAHDKRKSKEELVDRSRNDVIAHREEIAELSKLALAPKHMAVVRAAMRLVGMPEKKTREWKQMKTLFTVNFFKAVLQLDHDNSKTQAHLKDAEADIKDLTQSTVSQNSASVGYLFAFVTSHITMRDAKKKQKAAKEAAEKEAAAAAAAAEAAAGEE